MEMDGDNDFPGWTLSVADPLSEMLVDQFDPVW